MTTWFLSSCALIAILILLRRVLRSRLDPRLLYALWLLAALRVLIPVSLFSAPVSVAGLAARAGVEETVEQVRQVISPKTVGTTTLPDDSDMTLEEYADSWNDSGLHVYDLRPYTEEELSEIREENPAFYRNTDKQPLRMTAELTVGRSTFWGWFYRVGAMAVYIVLFVCNRRFEQNLRRRRKPYTGPLPVACPIPVYVVDSLPSPCLCGLFRPAIYLNRAAVDCGRLDHILTHELTHYHHRDHWWALLRCACLVAQWFNPLVWLAAHLSRQDCELACDAGAIRALGEDQRLSYGKTLVDMVAAGHAPGALFQTATTMTGGKKNLKERILLIAKQPRMTALTLTAALLIAALAVGCTFGGAGTKEEAPLPEEWYGAYQTAEIVHPPIDDTPYSSADLTVTLSLDTFTCSGAGEDLATEDPQYTRTELADSVYAVMERFSAYREAFSALAEDAKAYSIRENDTLQLFILDGKLWLAFHIDTELPVVHRLKQRAADPLLDRLTDLPEELAEVVTVVRSGLHDVHFNSQVRYYYAPCHDESDPDLANLVQVNQMTPGGFERYYFSDPVYRHLGRDDSYYYDITGPSDVQVSDEYSADYARVQSALIQWLQDAFDADESTSPIDLSETPYVDDFSYDGNHIDAVVSVPGSDEVICTLVLSQPAAKGEGGIWCVERVYDPNEDEPRYTFLDADGGTALSAVDYYTQLQAQADAGEAFDCPSAGLTIDEAVSNFIDTEFALSSYACTYSELYSADKGTSRDNVGPVIEYPSNDPADIVQELYSSIVGSYDDTRGFYVEVDDGTVTRLRITAANGYNVDYTGNYLDTYQWQATFSGQSPSGTSLTMESANGGSYIKCWENSGLVLLHQGGTDTWMAAEPPTSGNASFYRWLLQIAKDAMRHSFTYGISVDGSVTDYQQVVNRYMEQLAAAWRNAPDWMLSKPEDAQPGSSIVTQAYTGEGENFCASTQLHIKIDPFSQKAGDWQAGAGLYGLDDGPYNTAAGYYCHYLGRSFARNENGDWVCTGMYTGGEELEFPTKLKDATVEQLVDYFYHTTGFAHDYRILLELRCRTADQLNALNTILAGHSDEEVQEFCHRMGGHLAQYPDYEYQNYDDLRSILEEPYRSQLEYGYEHVPSQPEATAMSPSSGTT